jgi:hypothetical protein
MKFLLLRPAATGRALALGEQSARDLHRQHERDEQPDLVFLLGDETVVEQRCRAQLAELVVAC